MTILKRLRNRPTPDGGDPGSGEVSSADAGELPMARYDSLDEKKLVEQLTQLSQVELADVEAHERSHEDRPAVLAKLRYLRESEPLPGYDALESKEIVQTLAGADTRTVKAVRDYERKFQHRKSVLDEAARVLPTSQASAGETLAREQQTALVREGFADRAASNAQADA
jgi:hypothetical protein